SLHEHPDGDAHATLTGSNLGRPQSGRLWTTSVRFHGRSRRHEPSLLRSARRRGTRQLGPARASAACRPPGADRRGFACAQGRGSRLRAMRPWTVVVLSDFGRDRVTYQAYERLFDPELPARSLPIANPAVIRMQAVFATLDWLAASTDRAQVWPLLQKPPGDD